MDEGARLKNTKAAWGSGKGLTEADIIRKKKVQTGREKMEGWRGGRKKNRQDCRLRLAGEHGEGSGRRPFLKGLTQWVLEVRPEIPKEKKDGGRKLKKEGCLAGLKRRGLHFPSGPMWREDRGRGGKQ